ncbi:MAG TPA: hypothetical protein VNC16_04895 [Solirubrobacterales bacterium]|jgi:hypothetical protein|nr:hypothetical protein [Solirubrobacterales bacterium]
MCELSGLIQHSFAVRIPRELQPQYAEEGVSDAHRLLRKIFEAKGFALGEAGMHYSRWGAGGDGPWDHSALVRNRQTTIEPRPFPFKEKELPNPVAWSKRECPQQPKPEDPWEGFVIGGIDRAVESHQKDFLLEKTEGPSADEDEGTALSQLLCQLLAHRRSRLFGIPLARETVNILLPYALLEPHERDRPELGGWFAQPALSLFYVYGSRGFRPIFSFSLFLIPCDTSSAKLPTRRMSGPEMHDSVRNQWPLATAFDVKNRPAFTVSGPLGDYLAAAAGPAMNSLGIQPATAAWTRSAGESDSHRRRLTLRIFTEATLFALALRMIGGESTLPDEKTRKEIGDHVLTTLSASRVSSVVVVDDNCAAAQPPSEDPQTPCGKPDLPKRLAEVSAAISWPYQMPAQSRDGYRLDRDFVDTEEQAMVVLPANRCIVTVGDRCAQQGLESSVLLEAGLTAYMVIGAATATGMIRSVFRDISRSDRSKPGSIADIEREAMVELHETYDLEIMTETYRRRYRLLRDHLGITDEFKALSDKLEALYRETSTRFEGRSEKRLHLLTWATAILSAVIAAGTLILIFKGG